MHRVRAKIETEKDKRQNLKRPAQDDKSVSRPQQRRRSSQQRVSSGNVALSPTAISPRTSANTSLPMIQGNNPTGSPTNSFTPVVNGTQSFTPQSQTGSSPSSELVYPFTTAMGMQQGLYTPFGNSPPLFPVSGQTAMPIPNEIVEISKSQEDDGSGQFWQSLFGPPGSSLPPHQYSQNFSNTVYSNNPSTTSPNQRQAEFRDPNDVNMDVSGDSTGGNLEEMDNGLVDWGDFIAQCSQVWVTE